MEIFLTIIGIIIAIFSNFFFRDNTESNHQNVGKPHYNQTDPDSSSSDREMQTSEKTEYEYEYEYEAADKPVSTIEDEQEEQRKQLAERMNAPENNPAEGSEHHAVKQQTARKSADNLTPAQLKMQSQMRRNLTKEGLINGVMMSEILGQPRAFKPYRSPAAQRKQKL